MLHTGLKKPLHCYGPDHELVYVLFTPAASPAPQVLTEAQGVTAVTRTGPGAFTLTFCRKPYAILPVSAEAIENDTTVRHQARVESTNAAAGTAAVTHKVTTFAAEASAVVVKGRLPDVAAVDAATSNRSYATSPVAGTLVKAQAQVVSGGPLNADAIVTNKIGGVAITGGAITLPNTSAVGTVVAVTPSAANVVAVGSIITGETDGGGSTTAAVDMTYTIQADAETPVGSDTVDALFFAFLLRVAA